MTKKRIIVLVVVLLVLGMAVADISYYLINRNDLVENSSLEGEIVIDKQYLIENHGVSEEELEGIDIAHFVWYCGYTSEELYNYDVSELLISYRRYLEAKEAREEIEKSKKDDYAEMFSREYKGGYEDEYQSEITIIAVEVTDGSYRESVVFDLANQTYYFGELMDVTDDYSQATASGELSEEDVEVIRELVGEAEVSKWKADMGWVRPWDHDYSTYVMQIECSDGNSYGYTGIRKLPENFSDFYFGLKDVKDL
ncbi:MAG: hypothetical protein IJ040_07635 [Lachnospiraceae bacterium]|nr:hypothetical protein [Lachnospiraceae bacterium]